MSPASMQLASTTCSAISSIAIVTSPPGATPTRSRAPGSPSDGATASRTRAVRSTAKRSMTGSRPSTGFLPGRYERAGVELEVAVGEAAHRELLGPLSPGRDESRAQRAVVEQPAERVAQRADIAGRHQQGVLSRPRHVLIPLDRGRD